MKYLIGAVCIVGILAIPFGTAKYHMFYNEIIGTDYEKSLKDKEREVFKSSKPYIENTVQTLHNYKMQYDLANDEDKIIIANNIRTEFANFDSSLIENYQLRIFLEEIRGGY